MLCPICDGELKEVDGIILCDDGHIYRHSIELVERVGGSHTTIDRSKPKNSTKHVFPMHYARLLIFKKLFHMSESYFGLKSDLILQLFFWLIDKNEMLQANDDLINSHVFFLLIYLEKRREIERNNDKNFQVLFVNDFMKVAKLYKYTETLLSLQEKFDDFSLVGMKMEFKKRGFLNFIANDKLKILNEIAVKMVEKPQKRRFLTQKKSNIFDENKSAYAHLFLTFCENSVEVHFKYFEKIVFELNLEKSESLIYFVKKFLFINVERDELLIPELDICAFLCDFYTIIETNVDWLQKLDYYLKNRKIFGNEKLITSYVKRNIEEYEDTNMRLLEKSEDFEHEAKIDCFSVFAYFLDVSKIELNMHCAEMRKNCNSYLRDFYKMA